jgi:hypothetical protein
MEEKGGAFMLPLGVFAIALIVSMVSLGTIALLGDVVSSSSSEVETLVSLNSTVENHLNVTNEGLLIVAHGMPGQWNARVIKTMSEVDVGRPTEIGFLEYSPLKTIDTAVQSLLDQGVDSIITVPIFICGNSSHSIEVFEDVENSVGGRVPLFITESMEDHDLIMEILIDHGLGLCGSMPYRPRDKIVNPDDASLILYAHGDSAEYFEGWERLAEKVEAKLNNESIFEEVRVAWAGSDVETKLQSAAGHPLIVPWMVSYSEYSDAEIRVNAFGYEYEYDGKHLMDHGNSVRWVEWEFDNWKEHIAHSNLDIEG